ncbi:hypothetical protein [Streptomyces sp. Isolate_219]|nr:hypothetical protein [Streptomyces sp. Isolate_219]
MSTEHHDADAYGQELARISQHQSEATTARAGSRWGGLGKPW